MGRYQIRTDIRQVTNVSAELRTILGDQKFALVASHSAAMNPFLSNVFDEFAPAAKVVVGSVQSEPSVEWLESHIRTIGTLRLDHIVAIGGGSCIDAAKVFAAAIAHNGATSLLDLARNQSSPLHGTPFITAIPTTAGTGSEVTSFATVWDRSGKQKLSIDDISLAPTHALLASSALRSLPGEVAAPPLLDAMSHALESLWNATSSEFSEVHACAALRNIFWYGLNFLQGTRDDLTLGHIQSAATHAGIAIQQTRTSIAHAISYPLTLKRGIPHGHACSFLLPAIWTYAAQRDPVRYSALCSMLGHSSLDETTDRINEMLLVGQTHSTFRAAGFRETDVDFDEVQKYSRSQSFSAPFTRDALTSWIRDFLSNK